MSAAVFHLLRSARLLPLAATALLVACGSAPEKPTVTRSAPPAITSGGASHARYFSLDDPRVAEEIVVYAYGLLGIGYQFGGRNPEAGLDCSGMVSYIVEEVSGRRLPHNAAQIASQTRPISTAQLQPGDLVFFNTLNRRHSHMGIYLGEGRFIHAPSSRSTVRVDRLDNPYFKPRIDGARTLIANR